jgi:predicted RecA/RadA family phage recombinase
MATTTTVESLLRNGDNSTVLVPSASGALATGEVTTVGDGRIGIVQSLGAVASGDPVTLKVLGQFDLRKNATTDTYAVGDAVYWDNTNNKAKTACVGGYLFAGRCVKASANGDVYVYTDINVHTPLRLPVCAVAAAGSVIGDATALSEGINIVSAADDTKGVALPVAVPGMVVIVKSTVSNKILKVWPAAAGTTINALTVSTALSLASGATPAIFVASSTTQWYTIPLLPS